MRSALFLKFVEDEAAADVDESELLKRTGGCPIIHILDGGPGGIGDDCFDKDPAAKRLGELQRFRNISAKKLSRRLIFFELE